jgi:hypothetical protein
MRVFNPGYKGQFKLTAIANDKPLITKESRICCCLDYVSSQED